MSGIEIGALSILVSAMVWYLKYQTKRQAKREDKLDIERAEREKKRDEERKEGTSFIRNLVTNDIKDLHKDNIKGAELNTKTIQLQKDLEKGLKEHNGHSKEAWEKTIESLGVICDKLNGKK